MVRAMPSNAEAAEIFRSIADLLDVMGERFKPEAYRRAARSIDSLTEDLAQVAARGELRSVPGVGEAIEEKLREYLTTGHVHYLDRLQKEVPPGVAELLRVPGLGPKTARRFWVDLGIEGPAELIAALDAGRLAGVKGFGVKKIAQIRSAVEAARGTGPATRLPIETAYPVALEIIRALRERAGADRVEVAGSFRRGRETVGDLDVLVTSREPTRAFDVFSALPEVREVRLRGSTKETVILTNGLQVDLRVVDPGSFGAALQYFTGSKDHNVLVRTLAKDAGLRVNEYGVYRGEQRVAGATEEEVYAALGLAWIPPSSGRPAGRWRRRARGPYRRWSRSPASGANSTFTLLRTPTPAPSTRSSPRRGPASMRTWGSLRPGSMRAGGPSAFPDRLSSAWRPPPPPHSGSTAGPRSIPGRTRPPPTRPVRTDSSSVPPPPDPTLLRARGPS